MPSILRAAESAAEHPVEEPGVHPIRRQHRQATIAFYRLMCLGVLGLFFLLVEKQ